MCRLHCLLDHCYQALLQGVQVNFVAQVGTEGFQCTSRVILAAVEAPVNNPLNELSKRLEQDIDRQRGANDSQLIAFCKPVQEELQTNDASEVDQGQQCRQRTIDKRAMDDDINIPEARA